MSNIVTVIRGRAVRFFSKSFGLGMLRQDKRLGEMPTTRQAYIKTVKIAWPSALESVLISLVGFADTIMVSGLGVSAVATVGITSQPKYILLAIIFSLNVGVTAVVSRRFGQNDRESANRCARQCIFVSAVLSTILSLVGMAFAPQILRMAGAQDDIIKDASGYFRIILMGMAFSSVNLTINAAQRGVGNTKVAMRTNLASNLVNLIFNYFLIEGNCGFPALGVYGDAIATTLGVLVAFCMAVRSLQNPLGFLHINLRQNFLPNRETIRSVWTVSYSAMIEQVFLRIGFFLYALNVAKLGTMVFGTHQICMNILNLSFAVGDGLGVAASALVGQNLGAKRPDLSLLYGKICQRIALCFSTLLALMFIFGRTAIVSLFTDEREVLLLGAQLMIVMAFTSHVQTSQVIVSGCLRGAGDTRYVAMVSLVSVALIRPTLSWLLCHPLSLGLLGAWLAIPIDQITRLICVFIRFSGGQWSKIEL